jgi:hypothetical protein
VRSSPASTCGSPSFKDHQEDHQTQYTVEVLERLSLCPCCFWCFFEPRDIGRALSDSNWVNATLREKLPLVTGVDRLW